MFRKLLITTAISSALAIAPVALAEKNQQGQGQQSRQMDQQMDRQMDQQMDQQGGQQGQQSQQGGQQMDQQGPQLTRQDFIRLDQNSDGMLDEEELSRYGSPAAGGEQLMQRYDQDQDGTVTRKELQLGQQQQQQSQDQSQDGQPEGEREPILEVPAGH